MKTYNVKLTNSEISFICLAMGAFIGVQMRERYDDNKVRSALKVVNPILRKLNKAKGEQ